MFSQESLREQHGATYHGMFSVKFSVAQEEHEAPIGQLEIHNIQDDAHISGGTLVRSAEVVVVYPDVYN